jgi:hypothetical protein
MLSIQSPTMAPQQLTTYIIHKIMSAPVPSPKAAVAWLQFVCWQVPQVRQRPLPYAWGGSLLTGQFTDLQILVPYEMITLSDLPRSTLSVSPISHANANHHARRQQQYQKLMQLVGLCEHASSCACVVVITTTSLVSTMMVLGWGSPRLHFGIGKLGTKPLCGTALWLQGSGWGVLGRSGWMGRSRDM